MKDVKQMTDKELQEIINGTERNDLFYQALEELTIRKAPYSFKGASTCSKFRSDWDYQGYTDDNRY